MNECAEESNKRKKKIYFRISESIHNKLKKRSEDDGVQISHVFQDAIDTACKCIKELDFLFSKHYKRTKGRRLASETRPIGTIITEDHYNKLKGIGSDPKRFLSDVIEVILIFYLKENSVLKDKRNSFFEFYNPHFKLDSIPRADIGSYVVKKNSFSHIKSNDTVLLTESVLLFGSCTDDDSKNYLKPFSILCWKLLERCRTGDVIGIITINSIMRFSEKIAQLSSNIEDNEHKKALFNRILLLMDSPLRIIEPTLEDVQYLKEMNIFGEVDSKGNVDPKTVKKGDIFYNNSFELAVEIACLKRLLSKKVAIATCCKHYDYLVTKWNEVSPDSQLKIRKPDDIGAVNNIY